MEETIQIQLRHGGTINAALCNSDKSSTKLIRARGIPYAKVKRFQKPQPLPVWDEVLDCTKPAPICAQNPSRLNHVTGDLNQCQAMSEECLHLTVTAPQAAKSLPVLVWFHGGAYLSGGADLDCYWPSGMASRGIVTVNVSYRLGIFGYLPIQPEVPANLGLLDQIEALRWVHDNITAFGGDPAQVTIAGQSAGAHSVACLLVSPAADGLFRRTILQSTPLGMPHHIAKEDDQKLAEFVKKQNFDLFTSPTEDLLKLQTIVLKESRRLGVTRVFWPRFGEDPLPETKSLDEAIVRRVTAPSNPVALLISWAQDEATAFLPMMEQYSYYMNLPVIGSLFAAAFNRSYSGRIFVWPSQALHEACRQAGGSSWTCCFRFKPHGSRWGATHCIDLPYLFGSRKDWEKSPMVGDIDSLNVIESVGEDVKDLWAAFIRGEALESDHYTVSGKLI